MNLKKDGSFVIFKDNGEIKQISHTDNNVIWFTDKSFLYPMDYDLVKPITLKQINNLLNKLRQVNKKSNTKKSVCDHYYSVNWSESRPIINNNIKLNYLTY